MKNHIFSIFFIALIIGSSLIGCAGQRYVEKNDQPVRNEKRHHREDRMKDGRYDLRNLRSIGPFTFIFPQVL